MAKKIDAVKKITTQTNNKYQISIYLDTKDIEEVKAVSVAQDASLSSVIVNLIREGLKKEEYQKTIRAYQQFKNTVS